MKTGNRSVGSAIAILCLLLIPECVTAECEGPIGGAPAWHTTTAPTLDGYIDTNLYTLITENPYASPVFGGSTNNSDAIGESSACHVYSVGGDPNIPNFQSVNICDEGHTADIKRFFVTWDETNLYLAVEGPNAFHRGFGAPDRADMFIAIDTLDSRCDDRTPIARKGGDGFTKTIDFAGWQPNYFIGVEYITNGGASGYAVLKHAQYDTSGNVTNVATIALDTTPNSNTNGVLEFNGRRDTAVTEFRIQWSAFGGEPDACAGEPWNFALYTTGDLDNFDAYDTAPGIGQATNGFEMLGDVPFEADWVATNVCGGICNSGCGDGQVDPVSGSYDSSAGYNEDDHHRGVGCSNGYKVPSSDNSSPSNNNEVDTIQAYFRITNIGQLPPAQLPGITCPGNVSTNVSCGEGTVAVTWSSPSVSTGSCPIEAVFCIPASGSQFAVGVSTVQCVVVDIGGNSNTCSFTVTVGTDDTEPPYFTGVPASTNVECGAHESYLDDPGGVTAIDDCDGELQVSYTAMQEPQQGCPPYIITRTWSATDFSSNLGSTQQIITVVDTTAPDIFCPDDITKIVLPGVTNAVVHYSATAEDACAGALPVTLNPPSGSIFPLGTSTVTAIAVDVCNNTNTCSFTVVVAQQALSNALAACRSGTPTLDGFLNPATEGWTLITEKQFARPVQGGSASHSDVIGETSAKHIYDCGADPTVQDFSAYDISSEGHAADIQDFYVTWDTNYIYFAVAGPNAFHDGFGAPNRADLFIAIDTEDSRISDTTPVARKGGDMFTKNVDFAGWQPHYFIGVERITNGGGSGYAQVNRAWYDSSGNVTNTQILGQDFVPNTVVATNFQFNGRRDTAITEFRVKWDVFGGRPEDGAVWNFALYTAGNADNYDAYDTAPSVGQATNGFEVLGDVPFDADWVSTGTCGGICNSGCGDGQADPVTGGFDSSAGYGEDDHHRGPGCANGAKVPASDNSNPFNNNEVDTIQAYFQVANVGVVEPGAGCEPDTVGIKGEYYNNANFTAFVLERVDGTIDFDWGTGSPDGAIGTDTFSVRWTGQLLAETNGVHTFSALTDDGVRLWIDGQLLLDQWVNQGATEISNSVNLAAGYHDIVMEYFDNTGNARAHLSWSGPGISKQIIPRGNLWAAAGAVNHQPAKPVITSPSFEGFTTSAEDVHMETDPIHDLDGHGHAASDWIIWNEHTNEIAWASYDVTGAERVHIHLGDGDFVNSHAGRTALFFDTNYVLAVRHKDDSGDPATEWSPWSYRGFHTQPLGAGSSNQTWLVHEPGFEVQLSSHGFQLPVNIAFHPAPGTNSGDVLYYVTELYGSIKAVTVGGQIHSYATNVLNFNPFGAFPGSGEKGLTGIYVEDDGNLLTTMLYAPDTNSPTVQNPKVTRFFSSADGLQATGSVDILRIPEASGASHQISHIEVGPEGLIYVHVGDGNTPGNALNTNSYQGKILRMNPDGSPATSNPFYNAADGTNATDYIYAYGLRNPFGGAWHFARSNYYEVENGPDVDRMEKIAMGAHYRWDGSNSSISNGAFHVIYPITAPVNMAFIEDYQFGYSGYPTQFWDNGFISESGPTWGTGPFTNTTVKNGKRIKRFVFDSSGNIVTNMPFVEYIGTGKATCSGLAAGPDGLYFTDLYKDLNYSGPTDAGANVWRIKYVGTNVATAVLSPDGGTFTNSVDVTITCTTPFADLHWTTNGVDPTTSDPFVSSGQSVDISASVTLKVKGFRPGYSPSAVTSGEFTIVP